jgi:hypothetical protein
VKHSPTNLVEIGGLQIRLLPFVLQLPLFSCSTVQAEPCRVTCANATLDMNCDSYFPVHKHEKILRHNPLKTSEISKLLKSNKSLKEKYSFRLMTIKNQQIIVKIGGARRDRTADLLRARQALSQLSYGPVTCPFFVWLRYLLTHLVMYLYVHSRRSFASRLASRKKPCVTAICRRRNPGKRSCQPKLAAI